MIKFKFFFNTGSLSTIYNYFIAIFEAVLLYIPERDTVAIVTRFTGITYRTIVVGTLVPMLVPTNG